MRHASHPWVYPERQIGPPPSYGSAGNAISPLIRQVLHSRGVSEEGLSVFLARDASTCNGATPLSGIAIAVARLLRARDMDELVFVYGDADVDGITATALLVGACQRARIRVRPYIPDPGIAHSGLSRGALEDIARQGASLIVTVDCGISDAAEIAQAATSGLEFIVTDHHIAPPSLPRAVAVIDPNQPECPYPFKDLSGVGVAYKLAEALLDAAGSNAQDARLLLDLVALGTLADMAPLIGENRLLVWQGLQCLAKCGRPGLRALLDGAGLRGGEITASEVATRVCPLINAAGRRQGQSLAYLLLTAPSIDIGRGYVNEMSHMLERRQATVAKEVARCLTQLPKTTALDQEPLLVVHIDAGASSVAGIVAGKILAMFARPVLVLRQTGDCMRGTLRATSFYNLLGALASVEDLLTHYGGHHSAAGFTAPVTQGAALVRGLQEYFARAGSGDEGQASLQIDAEIQLQQVTWKLYDQLAMFEPCGIGNPQPLFLCRRLRLLEYELLGNGNLRMVVRDGDKRMTATAYRRGDLIETLGRTLEVDLVFNVECYDRGGARSLQLQVRDVAVRNDW